MGFIKRHYEKIILSLVLLGLAGAAGWLTVKVSGEKKKLREEMQQMDPPTGASVSYEEAEKFVESLGIVSNPPPVEIEGPHMLFNPVLWKQAADGTLIKVATGSEAGIGAVSVTGLKALSFTIEFSKSSGSSPDRMRYALKFHEQDAVDKRGKQAKPKTKYASLNGDFGEWPFEEQRVEMILKEVQGDPMSPTGFVIGMKDANDQDLAETITLAVDTPYSEVREHLVDLRYDAADTDYKDKRRGEKITVDGESYNIVAISEVQVVLSAERNGKRYTIPIQPESDPVP